MRDEVAQRMMMESHGITASSAGKAMAAEPQQASPLNAELPQPD